MLVDAGPFYQAAHLWFCQELQGAIDAAVVVRDAQKTSMSHLDDVCLRMRQAGIQDVSVVENFETPANGTG